VSPQPEHAAGDVAGHGHLPPWLARAFSWTWSAATGTRLGAAGFVLLVYVLPYGLVLAALGTQINARGEFEVLAGAALVAATFASAQPAPTPLMGTLSLVLVGIMGSAFDPVLVGVAAGLVATVGLLTSFGAGAAGIGALLLARLEDRHGARRVVESAFSIIRKRGAWAVLVLSFIPSAIYAWSSVAAGASGMRLGPFLGAAAVGSIARFIVVAAIGIAIVNLFS
jgi:uncharacterized membrane protein YdjX (TVP38/TMEM64 family)